MRGIRLVACVAAMAAFAQGAGACERPDDISIPDGRNANEADMIAADAAYRRFMDAMREYQACLAADSDRQRPGSENKEALRQYENAYVARHNAASDAMTRTTDAFNKAIDEYKARQ